MQTPTPGRMVTYAVATQSDLGQNNGADTAPAVITRVWHDGLVNLQVFFDAGAVQPRTSVPLYETADGYAEAKAAGRPMGCYWPTRV